MDTIEHILGQVTTLDYRLKQLNVPIEEIKINKRVWETIGKLLTVNREKYLEDLISGPRYEITQEIYDKHYGKNWINVRNLYCDKQHTIDECERLQSLTREMTFKDKEYQEEVEEYNRLVQADKESFAEKHGTPPSFMVITGSTPNSLQYIKAAVQDNGLITTSEKHDINRNIIGYPLWDKSYQQEVTDMLEEDGAVMLEASTGKVMATNAQVDNCGNDMQHGMKLDEYNKSMGVNSGNTGVSATAIASRYIGPSYRLGASGILKGFANGAVIISSDTREDYDAMIKHGFSK
jgi:hypothetical protein